jgi:hypothetical protein
MNPQIQQSPAAPSPVSAPPINPHFKPAPASVKQDVFTTDAGEVVVRWPDFLTAEEFSDIEGWLDMLKRKIKRSVKSESTGEEPR